MFSDKQQRESNKEFEPLEVMGIFWLFFGIIVLVGTFFVKPTPDVPLIRGIVTNLIAALLLLAAGIFSIFKGKANKRRSGKNLKE
ncbi:MAG: hypothetical protein ACETWK_06795 [Candidatus Aminicenantaceae bacterium]